MQTDESQRFTNPPARAENCRAEKSAPSSGEICLELGRIVVSAAFRDSLRLKAFVGDIAIGMKKFGDRGLQDDAFVGRQVELNSGKTPRRRNRPFVTDLALA